MYISWWIHFYEYLNVSEMGACIPDNKSFVPMRAGTAGSGGEGQNKKRNEVFCHDTSIFDQLHNHF